MHGELLSQLSPPTSVDPLTLLPRELAERIFEYLTFQQRIAVSRVSKQWHNYIRSSSNLWQHLDLSNPKRKVRTAFVSKAINTGRQKLTAATLSMLHDFDKVLHALVRHCPLEQLALLDTGLQGHNLIEALRKANHLKSLRLGRGTEIGPSTVNQLLYVCTALESFEFVLQRNEQFSGIGVGWYERLQDLKVTLTGEPAPALAFTFNTIGQRWWIPPTLDRHVFWSMQTSAPNLRSITLHDQHPPSHRSRLLEPVDLTKLRHLKCLDLALQIESAAQLRLPPCITELSLVSTLNRAMPAFFHHSAGGIASLSLPCLEKLKVRITCLNVALVQQFLSEGGAPQIADSTGMVMSPSKLRELDLHSMMVSTADLNALLAHPRLGSIEHFCLKHSFYDDDSPTQSDDVIPGVIRKRLSGLQYLDLSTEPITGVGVKTLVQGSQLKHLVVSDCRNLGSDAVEWARAQGVRVDYKMTSSEGGRKKLRY